MRLLALVIGVPLTVFVGMSMSGMVVGFTGASDLYVAAVIMPTVGLGFAWYVAPQRSRWYAVGAYVAVGLLLAFMLVYLPWAEDIGVTYGPFWVTVGTAILCVGLLAVVDRRGRSGA